MAAPSRLAWLLLALAVACAGACGEAGEPDAAAEGELEPGEFRMVASTSPRQIVRTSPGSGRIEQLGLPLASHVAEAWRVHLRDIELRALLPEGRFDVRVRASDGRLETAAALLRGGLAESLGIVVTPRARSGDRLELRRVGGGLAPEPVTALAEPGGRARTIGRYRGGGATIADLARYLRTYTELPVVDATGLEGLYDIVIEWDPDAGARAMQAALRDAGFVLAREPGSYVVWTVEPAS